MVEKLEKRICPPPKGHYQEWCCLQDDPKVPSVLITISEAREPSGDYYHLTVIFFPKGEAKDTIRPLTWSGVLLFLKYLHLPWDKLIPSEPVFGVPSPYRNRETSPTKRLS